MPTITLPMRVYNHHQLKLTENFLKPKVKALNVKTEISTASRGWIRLTATGEDEKVALHYLAEEIGSCPTRLKQVQKFSTIKGYITSLNEKEIHIDIGISSPSIIDATIPLQNLQAQLVDGRKTALKKIAELFGLVQNLPLTVKIRRIDKGNSQVEAMLSERHLTLYRNWTKSLLDRLIVLGASSKEVKQGLKRSNCNRDVVNVQSLAFLEQAIVCKLGTDAVGLIPKIGGKLPNAKFTIFDPKRILKFLEDYQVL